VTTAPSTRRQTNEPNCRQRTHGGCIRRRHRGRTNAVPKEAALLQSLVKLPLSNFEVDAASSLYAFTAAMEKGRFTREGINTAVERKLFGLVTPDGWLRLSPRNHTGLQLESMWAGTVTNCKPKPLGGPAFNKKRK
jgi:uncharacterized membrane-anchored protein